MTVPHLVVLKVVQERLGGREHRGVADGGTTVIILRGANTKQRPARRGNPYQSRHKACGTAAASPIRCMRGGRVERDALLLL
mgnify:CR=1 FL=1